MHKLEYSKTRVFVWFSTLIFQFHKMVFMNKLEFSYFADFFVMIFITREEPCFSLKSARKAWSKRLEFFVKLMSKNSISGY